ncbi:unnamed protein product [Dicrocoelium dendriticum]|nr:unnamed protein product [Dicrocoelium dendriticum]
MKEAVTYDHDHLHRFVTVCQSLFGSGSDDEEDTPVNLIRASLNLDRLNEELTRLKRDVSLMESNREIAQKVLLEAGLDISDSVPIAAEKRSF